MVVLAQVAFLAKGMLKTMMLNKLKIVAALLLVLVVVAVGAGIIKSSATAADKTPPASSDEPKKSGSGSVAEPGVPPDIKVGVRIEFVSGQLSSGALGVKVIKIEGNWVYVDGGMFHPKPGDTKGSPAWINLSRLEWYRVVQEKKGS